MREYKFRIWDKKYKTWNHYGINLFGEMILMGYLDSRLNVEGKWEHVSLDRLNDLVVTQFIGLKDKNEKDIYDGDVVKVPAGYSGDYRYEECKAIVTYEAPEFFLLNIEGNGLVSQEFGWSELEIIGNIFEEKKSG